MLCEYRFEVRVNKVNDNAEDFEMQREARVVMRICTSLVYMQECVQQGCGPVGIILQAETPNRPEDQVHKQMGLRIM